jgi:mono/diheme cytochrome c family protein
MDLERLKRDMASYTATTGNWIKAGLATLGAAVLVSPLVSAVANPVDPSQMAVEEETGAADAGLTAEQVVEARDLFNSWSCNACHVLADANAHGHIGPTLDGNNAMDKAFIVARVTNGQGAMPGFGGQMSDEEIDLVAAYIMEAKK